MTRSQQDAGLAGLCDQASGVRRPVAHRLLEQQVDAGREKRLGHGEVGVGRGEHVRRIGLERHHLVEAPDDRLDPGRDANASATAGLTSHPMMIASAPAFRTA